LLSMVSDQGEYYTFTLIRNFTGRTLSIDLDT
jgi:hypothetical protein